jgi:hypothetical protein
MTKELYSLILSNSIIIETLFHLNNNYQINIINQTKRTIVKSCPLYHIYDYIPILKDLFNDIYNENNNLSYLITETFENNSIIYEIKINNHPLFDNYNYIYKFRFYIYLSIDDNNKNKINIHLKTNKINIDDPNPINHTIINIITNYIENDHINYIKKDILEKELKPLLSSINPHFFELNII